MAAVSSQTIVPAGIVPTYAAANASDTIAMDDAENTYIHVKNGGGSSINVTVTAQETSRRVPGIGNVTISNLVVAVANGAEKIIGPFSKAFIDSSGNLNVAFSATSSVTYGAFKLPRVS